MTTPNPATTQTSTQTTDDGPDPARVPGRHLLHTRLGYTRTRDLLADAEATGDLALTVSATQIAEAIHRLDATAHTLERHLACLGDYARRLAAGGRISPCIGSTAMTSLGADIDMAIAHQDQLRGTLDQLTELHLHLTARATQQH
ncbi:hypothetical protein ABUW04_06915 [Streptacidiphilus sp. N1-10]|uniref:Uncharacterized protein n=1 Tax=Streptacidiphilus jeojiensis TaxID=3229225 RepID=A0ABV6XI91_9ACTN